MDQQMRWSSRKQLDGVVGAAEAAEATLDVHRSLWRLVIGAVAAEKKTCSRHEILLNGAANVVMCEVTPQRHLGGGGGESQARPRPVK